MMFSKSIKDSSLIGKLNGAFVLFVVTSVAAIVLTSFLFLKSTIESDRSIFLNTIGGNIVTMIERPFSLGDYSEVQSFILTGELPIFIKSIGVFDLNGAERAFNINGNNDCSLVEAMDYPIFDGSEMAGTVRIHSTTCDLRKRFNTLIVYSVLFSLVVIFIGIFLGKRFIIKAFRPVLDVIGRATALDNFSEDLTQATPQEFRPLMLQLAKSYEHLTRSKLLDELIHNLSSPVKVLKLILKKAKDRPFSGKDFEEAWNSALQIEQYIRSKHADENTILNVHRHTFLDTALESLAYGKQQEFNGRKKNVTVEFNGRESGHGIFVAIERAELRSVLSNLINNAYDAIESEGLVTLTSRETDKFHEIIVKDNGQGISDEHLLNIFVQDFSLKGSSGLGLSHAKDVIENHGGKICVASELGKGTSFTLSLPKAPRPDWILSEINLSYVESIVIVDDEPVHVNDWKERPEIKDYPIHYMSNREELASWVKSNGLSKTLFIVDFEINGSGYNGIDIIKEFELENAFICTNTLRGPDVYFLCEQHRLKMLPKPLVHRIPIKDSLFCDDKIKAIFLDDDDRIDYLVDDLKNSFGIESKVYYDPDALLSEINMLPKDIVIFLDKNLGPGKCSGNEVARKLKSAGLSKLVASSGSKLYTDEEKELYVNVVSKLEQTEFYANIIDGHY